MSVTFVTLRRPTNNKNFQSNHAQNELTNCLKNEYPNKR